jgi:hypothetical protein
MRKAQLAALVFLTLPPRTATPQGDPLGPEFRVNTHTTADQAAPRVTVASSGDFIVVWTSYLQDGSGNGIFGQRYVSSGSPSGPEFRVNTYTFASQAISTMASDGSGNFIVAWQSYTQDGSSWGTFGQRYTASGEPLGSEFGVNTYTTGSQAAPFVAADSAGNFVVVWQGNGQDGASYGVFGQRYASTGASLGPEFRVNTHTTGSQRDPAIASDPLGNFVVLWEGDAQDGSSFGVFGQRFASTGAPLGVEFRVNSFTTSYQGNPAVASSASGDFVVVWESLTQDGSLYGVFGQRFAGAGLPLGPEFRVNTYTTLDQQTPIVAADGSGNFVVAWASVNQDGSDYGVYGQRYAAAGVPSGPEFRVNGYSTDAQWARSLAVDAGGSFIVVWQSDTQDGSGWGVFGQRFGQIVPAELTNFTVE